MIHSTFKVAAVAAIALSAMSAHAALSLTGVSCSGHGTSMVSQPGYLDCAGAYDGNNLGNAARLADVDSAILTEFGLSGLTAIDITGGNGTATSGTLTFAAQAGPFVISVKAGDAFSLYEFSGGGATSLNFDTLGVGFFSGPNQIEHFGQGLSHATLYASAAPVPEPETYALMMAGLGVLGFVARRRKA